MKNPLDLSNPSVDDSTPNNTRTTGGGGGGGSTIATAAKGSTTAGSPTSTAASANRQPQDVTLYDASGNVIPPPPLDSNNIPKFVPTTSADYRALKGNQQTTITSLTSETTIVTADPTYKLDIYGLVLANSSATATKVTIKDSTTGTTRVVLYVPAGETRGFMLPSGDGHKQAAVNNNWTATCGTSVASLDVTALFVKNS